MKKITLTLLIITISINFYTLKAQYVLPNPLEQNPEMVLKMDSLRLKHNEEYMKSCFQKFADVHIVGTVLISFGAAITIVSAYKMRDDEKMIYGIYTGIGFSIIGWIVQQVSFRWMISASLSPAEGGIGIKVNL